ncbi:MAG: type II toxin-antitoxin system VapC family toxin [Bdellovibrionales bacterium]
MSGFVLDCSVAIAWVIEAEATAETDALMARASMGGVFVPELWPIETANVLLQAVKRKRLTEEQAQANRTMLGAMPIIVEEGMALRAWDEIMPLAQRENLTVYDAVYLDLAMRKRLPLASLDKALREAAGRNGIAVLPKKI